MKTLPLPLVLVFSLLLCLSVSAQQRGPSTPEERQKAVQIARSLEAEPLQAGNKDMRQWLTLWLIEVPDVSISVCGEELGPVFHQSDRNKNFANEIFGQSMFSSAAFVIEHPDKAKDAVALYTAGLEGSLTAYQSILKTHPDAKWPFLDDLIQRQTKGELSDYVKKATAKCRKK